MYLYLVYVDDMILLTESNTYLGEVKQKLLSKFDMKDLTDLVNGMKFLGTNITKTEKGLSLNQTDVIDKLVDKFKLTEVKPTNVPVEPKLKLSNQETVDEKYPFRKLVGGKNKA